MYHSKFGLIIITIIIIIIITYCLRRLSCFNVFGAGAYVKTIVIIATSVVI